MSSLQENSLNNTQIKIIDLEKPEKFPNIEDDLIQEDVSNHLGSGTNQEDENAFSQKKSLNS